MGTERNRGGDGQMPGRRNEEDQREREKALNLASAGKVHAKKANQEEIPKPVTLLRQVDP